MPGNVIAKNILNKTRRRDPFFLDDYTVNAYSGCSFNCLFCYIRGSKYGTNMADKLSVKTNAVELFERQLYSRYKKRQFGFVVLSSATEPYQIFERDLGITRQMLEIILKYRFPVHVLTRSDLVIKDFDVLEKIDKTAILPPDIRLRTSRGVFVTFSFSTLDDKTAKIFEPGATAPSLRLTTLKACLDNQFVSGVSLMPLLPFISDTAANLEALFSAFSQVGANYVFPSGITLFGNSVSDSKTLVLRAIKKHYPHLEERYHRYFDNSDYLPGYYTKAFKLKMRELSEKYNMPDRIVRLD